MRIVSLFLIYKFLRGLSKPWTSWKAYKTGVIDAEGKILVPANKRNQEQRKSFSTFRVLLRNLKLVLNKVPFGRTRLANFAAALFLIREDANSDITEDEMLTKLMDYMKEVIDEGYLEEADKYLFEDTPTNATSDNVAGVTGEPPVRCKKFAGCRIFEVDSDSVWRSRFGKKPYHRYSRYVGLEDAGEEVRQFARKHPKATVILQNNKTGEMVYLRKGLR